MVGFLKTFTQNSTTLCHTSRRQPDPPGDLTPQLWLCTQLVIALRRWRFTAEDTPAPAACANSSPRLSPDLWRCAQYVAVLPSTVHCRRYRNPPRHALMALYACPRSCNSTGQQVVVPPLMVHCRIYACPAVCTNGALCLYPRPVALQTAGCLTAIDGSLPRIRPTLHLR